MFQNNFLSIEFYHTLLKPKINDVIEAEDLDLDDEEAENYIQKNIYDMMKAIRTRGDSQAKVDENWLEK